MRGENKMGRCVSMLGSTLYVFGNADMHMTGDIHTRGMLAPVLETSQNHALDMIDCRCLCDELACVRHGGNRWSSVCKGRLVNKNIPGLALALECDCNFDHRTETLFRVARKN